MINYKSQERVNRDFSLYFFVKGSFFVAFFTNHQKIVGQNRRFLRFCYKKCAELWTNAIGFMYNKYRGRRPVDLPLPVSPGRQPEKGEDVKCRKIQAAFTNIP
jgi:hypothetical protein